MNFVDIYNQAFETGRLKAKKQAVEGVLSKYASDPTSAQSELTKLGAFDEANNIRQQAENQRNDKLREVYGAKANTGDYYGAAQEAAKAGDAQHYQMYSGLDEASKERARNAITTSAKVAKRLQELYPIDPRNPNDAITKRKEQLAKLAPHLSQTLGLPQDQILSADVSDDGINSMYAESQAYLKDHTYKTVSIKNADGSETIRFVDETAGQFLPDGSQSGAPAEQPMQSNMNQGTNEGTRAGRNNNAGNLRYDGHSKWQGMTGVDPQGFVIFDTPENGMRAAGINLANQQKLHGINTIEGLVQKYAPQSDNNDTAAYIQSVAQQTGLDPRQPLDFTDPAVQQKILPAMFKVEGGGTPARVPAAPMQQQTTQQNGPIRSMTGDRTPKPDKNKWRDATDAEKDRMHVPRSYGAQVNDSTGEFKVLSASKGIFADQAKQEKMLRAKQDTMKQAQDMGNTIDEAIKAINPFNTGVIGGATKGFEGGPAANLQALLDPIESGIALDKLNQIRQNSPTGGALGNVSDTDIKLLKSAIASLKLSQDPETLKKHLLRVKQVYTDIFNRTAADIDASAMQDDGQATQNGPTKSNW